jgi:hypothetical protein
VSHEKVRPAFRRAIYMNRSVLSADALLSEPARSHRDAPGSRWCVQLSSLPVWAPRLGLQLCVSKYVFKGGPDRQFSL